MNSKQGFQNYGANAEEWADNNYAGGIEHTKLPGTRFNGMSAYTNSPNSVTVSLFSTEEKYVCESFYMSPDEAQDFGEHLIILASRARKSA